MNEKDETQEVIDSLNEMSRNAGSVSFNVRYSAIPGNRKVHKQFVEFAANEANNNYISAINLLMKYRTIFEWLDRINERLDDLEFKEEGLRDLVLQIAEDSVDKETEEEVRSHENKMPKTF